MLEVGKKLKVSFLLLLPSMLLLSIGCAARRVSLIAEYGIRIEKVNHARVVFRNIDVVRKEKGAAVIGYAERDGIAVPPLGHVDVVVLNSHGNKKILAATWLSPRLVPRLHGGHSTFKLRLPFIPEPESIILVRYHPSLSIPDEEKPDW